MQPNAVLLSRLQTRLTGRDGFDLEAFVLQHAAKCVADTGFVIDYED